jgi:hypothetical protein
LQALSAIWAEFIDRQNFTQMSQFNQDCSGGNDVGLPTSRRGLIVRSPG